MTAILDRAVCPAPIRPLAPVVGADTTVPTTAGGETVYANLDYAASAPALVSVAERLSGALTEYASVHRGAGHLSQVTTARYEQARETVRRFVGGRSDDTVVFTRNTTDAVNLAAHVTPGDVVVLDIEHHANLLPWTRTGRARVVPAARTVEETVGRLEAELAAAPAALLAITGASNVTGEVLPIGRLAAAAHRHGARILVDAAQLVPHRAVSIASWGIDYLVFSGHKLYAPFGAGVLVGRGDWLDAAEPYLAGGGATADVDLDGGVAWHTGAARHEAGSPNTLGVVALAAAAQALQDIGFEEIGYHEHRLQQRLDEGLALLPGVHPLRVFDDAADRVGIAGFTVENHSPRSVAEYLSVTRGIGVRDGKFCAHPLLRKLGYPDGAVRASFGLGTSSDDVDRLLAALSDLVRR
ncbi:MULTISPECIES: aminotransferase class V-fold PLP-dependent enzyme [Gordonia]|uniref:Putative cysteine desulfurase n=1 Tax=Gordonia sihwensis NBRC 108236 TaxID=1223544 RepID=L7LI15_9ACTN|nr:MULTISPECIES: aminotransferase class V-fold PLP-dependent enzyme [Gordonia]AUH70154.1 aminotransferase class V-fold PLP-dependent enzyme [Gordonia sp. YC-JH1]KJR07962.1 cysteine desulfurase [Gordonia sihwensis]MBY4571422.1 cysteine desulfurase [Gordonia sihwensis]GAC60765.1 putative cysteine desulfurase [Gordonia sihwensis NBRC 108236]